MKNNNRKITLAILAFCVITWTVNVIVDIISVNRKNRSVKLALDSIFLASWTTALVSKLKGTKSDDTSLT